MSSMTRFWSCAAAIAVATSLWSTAAHAEDAAKPEEKGWERTLSLGLSATSGNSDSVLFVGSLEVQRTWEHDEFRGLITGAYGKNDGEKSNETGNAIAQYKRLFTDRFYGSAYVNLFHDGVADIAYRLTLAPGVGYYFIKSPRHQLSGEAGPSYVIEKLNGESTDDYFGLRLAERYEYQINDTARFWQSLEWVPQIDDFENYVAILEVGVEAALTKTLSVRLVGQDRYDNQPATGRERNDMSLVSSLSYKF